jgi:signal transduction histidine kinase
MSEDLNRIEALAEKLKTYLNTRLTEVKLSAAEKIAKVVSVFISVLLAALMFFLFLTILLIGIALLIGEWLQNYWLGFFITAGLVLVLGGIGWQTRDRWLRMPIMNLLLAATLLLRNTIDRMTDEKTTPPGWFTGLLQVGTAALGEKVGQLTAQKIETTLNSALRLALEAWRKNRKT